MKRMFTYVSVITLLLLWSSCRNDFEFSEYTGNLEFSKDTIYLDTVFTRIGSSTYTLKVYNKSARNINIPKITLGLKQQSKYRLNIDGNANNSFENVPLLAKDSLYIFIETTIDIANLTNANSFLYIDEIVFESGHAKQKIPLVTLVKDAYFIYPNRDNTTKITTSITLDNVEKTKVQGRYLTPNELHFTNAKPYVIYGYAVVPNAKILKVDAGVRVYFHNNSGIIVPKNTSIQVDGKFSNNKALLENEVIFEGDRLTSEFNFTTAQWGTICIMEDSKSNYFYNTTIKNGTIGLLCEGNPNTSKLHLKNVQIYNHSNYGVLGKNTDILAENVIINNAGQSVFASVWGGHYTFTHCTITNYWGQARQFPALYLSNTDNGQSMPLSATFKNCILYGNASSEVDFNASTTNFNFKFENCLLRIDQKNNATAYYNTNDTALYKDCIFNALPNFLNPSKNQLQIGENSSAINKGNPNYANSVPTDIINVSRVNAPDLGAYQHIKF